jgi:hypothetical protein
MAGRRTQLTLVMIVRDLDRETIAAGWPSLAA